MERKPKALPVQAVTVEEDPIMWFQNKGGTFRLAGNRIIKPNQTFQARESDIKPAFRDIVVSVPPRPKVEGKPVAAPVKTRPGKVQNISPVDPAPSVYQAVKNAETGLWDILDPLGKVISEQPIQEEAEAVELAKSLSS